MAAGTPGRWRGLSSAAQQHYKGGQGHQGQTGHKIQRRKGAGPGPQAAQCGNERLRPNRGAMRFRMATGISLPWWFSTGAGSLIVNLNLGYAALVSSRSPPCADGFIGDSPPGRAVLGPSRVVMKPPTVSKRPSGSSSGSSVFNNSPSFSTSRRASTNSEPSACSDDLGALHDRTRRTISPTISSSTSSMVTRPAVAPVFVHHHGHDAPGLRLNSLSN